MSATSARRFAAGCLVAGGLAFGGSGAMAASANATASGSAPDIVALALAYEHGEGVAKDLLKAAALYCEAARHGDPEAQYSLAWMYANGRGVAHDEAYTASLMAVAADAGHAAARNALAHVSDARGRFPDCMTPDELVLGPMPENETRDPFVDLPPEKQKIAELVTALAPSYEVAPRLALAVVTVESNFDPKAQSPKNARGLMQLIPDTALRFRVRNSFDARDNVRGGLAYLRWLLSYYRGEVALAAAAYNAGEAAVDRYRGIPPYPETRDYVQRVLLMFGRSRHPYDPALADPPEFVEPH